MQVEDASETAQHLQQIRMLSLASFVVLIYDLLLTFGDEVEHIWRGRKLSLVFCLWCLNRYLWPLGYIVVIVALHDPHWTEAQCQRYIYYPQVIQLVVFVSIGLYLIIYLQALWGYRTIILSSFLTLLAVTVAVKIWAIIDMAPVEIAFRGHYTWQFVGCFISSKSPPHLRFIYTYISEVIFDVIIIATLFYRRWEVYSRGISKGRQLKTSLVYGILCLMAITVANLGSVMFLLFAPGNLRNAMSTFSPLFASVACSRMMIGLRKAAWRLEIKIMPMVRVDTAIDEDVFSEDDELDDRFSRVQFVVPAQVVG